MVKKKEKQKLYRSLTGHDYYGTESGQSIRVEAGETLYEFPERAIKPELAAGKIEEAEEEGE